MNSKGDKKMKNNNIQKLKGANYALERILEDIEENITRAHDCADEYKKELETLKKEEEPDKWTINYTTENMTRCIYEWETYEQIYNVLFQNYNKILKDSIEKDL